MPGENQYYELLVIMLGASSYFGTKLYLTFYSAMLKENICWDNKTMNFMLNPQLFIWRLPLYCMRLTKPLQLHNSAIFFIHQRWCPISLGATLEHGLKINSLLIFPLNIFCKISFARVFGYVDVNYNLVQKIYITEDKYIV